MTGIKRKKGDACYHKHHDNTNNEPVHCDRCSQKFSDYNSFRDHILDCERTPSKGIIPQGLQKRKVPS